MIVTSPCPDHPYDILPLVLTGATQEIFGCIVDVDVTAEKPYKLLDTESITYDLRTRAAVSDFSPAKQYVLVRLTNCYKESADTDTKHQVEGCGNKIPIFSVVRAP